MNSLLLYFFNILNFMIPSTRFYTLKVFILRKAGAVIGENVRILRGVNISMSGKLIIGDHSHIGEFTSFMGGNANISIGSNVDIGPFVKFVCGTHMKDQSLKAAGSDVSYPIMISDGAWICTNSTILGGVTIGARTIVAAQALVNRDVPKENVVGGVPAKQLR
jgi:acetyltransferase-like isoleucine patch superfamily enzyme